MKVMIAARPRLACRFTCRRRTSKSRSLGSEHDTLWGGWIRIANGWVLDLPEMASDMPLPIT